MSTFDQEGTRVDETEEIEKDSGNLKKQSEEDKLMHSVLSGGKKEVDEGKMLVESINHGITAFNPDMVYKNLVDNYKLSEKTYGETLIRQLSGYDPSYVKKNVNIPEFRQKLKQNIKENVENLKDKGLVDKEGVITHDALKLSSIVMYMEELDHLKTKGWGRKKNKEKSNYGEREEVKDFENSRYRDVNLKQSVKQAVRREHEKVRPEDLKVNERKKKGKLNVIYAMDASGSMKGDKIGTAKKAGIALSYHAVQEKNKAGLIVFGSEVKKTVEPTEDFKLLLENLATVRASAETDIAKTIEKAVDLFPEENVSKHLTLITDALPTTGKRPIRETLNSASRAKEEGVTISLIGIDLNEEGLDLAERIVEVGDGRLYLVKNLEEVDSLVLQDYYSASETNS